MPKPPVLQGYVDVLVKVTADPAQTVKEGKAVKLAIGASLTVTALVTVAVPHAP